MSSDSLLSEGEPRLLLPRVLLPTRFRTPKLGATFESPPALKTAPLGFGEFQVGRNRVEVVTGLLLERIRAAERLS
jgi:hypothetical protein